MHKTILAGLLFTWSAVFTGDAWANTEAPPGMGQASFWVSACKLLDLSMQGIKLSADDAQLAATCLGAFNGIIAVNYITPPYLPFCTGDNDRPIDYVRIFLRFIEGHPNFPQKHFGLSVLVALGQAHPKSECAGPGK
jgi:hypothetical protein